MRKIRDENLIFINQERARAGRCAGGAARKANDSKKLDSRAFCNMNYEFYE